MEYIRRHLEAEILDVSKYYSAILLTGPRQSGKTTMLKKLSEEEGRGRKYVSLDDIDIRSQAINDPKGFLQQYSPPVLIDEVQYAPGLFTYIKIYIDSHHGAGDFWLTGSQIFRLMRGVRESLAGRVILFSMSPLSQREIDGKDNVPFTTDFESLLKESEKAVPKTRSEIYESLWMGGMPGRLRGTKKDRAEYYSSYISTYVARDVADLVGHIDAIKFNAFVRSAAARCAQLVNVTAMAEDADISNDMAKNWLNILETLGVVFYLRPYSNNALKRTIKTPKLYFSDTGLVAYLSRWTSPEVAEYGAMAGALFENYVVSEIMKSYTNAGIEPGLYYYRDRDTNEIDILIESDGKLCPVEIKRTASPDRRITRTFSLIEKSPLERGTSAVICTSDRLYSFDSRNLVVPVWLI
ncbi:MAG: ATP-binding protein [Clostridia bacterium]|nr:ATP-binding protein [Clostridia bacterium]